MYYDECFVTNPLWGLCRYARLEVSVFHAEPWRTRYEVYMKARKVPVDRGHFLLLCGILPVNSYHFFCVMSENNLTSKKYVCIMTKVRKRTNLQYIAEGREGQ